MKPRFGVPAVAVAVAGAALAACGGSERQLVGYVPPQVLDVGAVSLPDVANGGDDFALVGPPGGLLLVYFGYTNCPDACPITLGHVKQALEELGDDAERVDVAMVTVDPARDAAVLAEYVQSFVPDAHALATDDDAELRTAALAFNANYDVDARGDRVQVDHSDELYGVDDTGEVAIAWPLTPTTADDIFRDVRQLLDGFDDR